MAINNDIFTQTIERGLKADKDFRSFLLRFKQDGKTYRKTFNIKNLNWDKATRIRKAITQAQIFREENLNTNNTFDNNIKLNNFIEEYFQTMEQSTSYSKDKWKGEIQSFYKRFIQAEIGSKKIVDIRQQHIKSIILNVKKLGLSPRTQKITIEILNPIFKSAIANRIIIHNPCDGIKVTRPNTRKKVQNASQLLRDVFIAIKTIFHDDIFTQTIERGLKADKDFRSFLLRFKQDGKTYRKTFTIKNLNWDKATRKNKAKQDALTFKESFKSNTEFVNENIKMDDFIEQYFQTMEQSFSYSKDKWKGEIASYYKRYIKSEIGSKRIIDIRQQHIKNIILNVKNLELSPRTQKITLEILNPIFKSAIANRIIIYNPCDGIKVTRPNTRKKVQNASQLLKDVFIAIKTTFLDDMFFQAFFMFALQGRRKSEILTLKWKNIDFHNRLYTLENTKNGEEQTFILPDTIELLLLNMTSNRNHYVFESPTNSKMHIKNIDSQVNKLKKALNNPQFGIHYLRNIVVSAMAEQGVNSTFLSGALGHSDLNTVKKYLSIPYTKGSEIANQTIENLTK